jgi:hypothetical protein
MEHSMDFIPDRTLYAAVMFAKRMIRGGEPAGLSITKAASYYGVNTADVARFAGQPVGRQRRRRRRIR